MEKLKVRVFYRGILNFIRLGNFFGWKWDRVFIVMFVLVEIFYIFFVFVLFVGNFIFVFIFVVLYYFCFKIKILRCV